MIQCLTIFRKSWKLPMSAKIKESLRTIWKEIAMFKAQIFDPEVFPELLAEEVIL